VQAIVTFTLIATPPKKMFKTTKTRVAGYNPVNLRNYNIDSFEPEKTETCRLLKTVERAVRFKLLLIRFVKLSTRRLNRLTQVNLKVN
jgi:hypothetical protein